MGRGRTVTADSFHARELAKTLRRIADHYHGDTQRDLDKAAVLLCYLAEARRLVGMWDGGELNENEIIERLRSLLLGR
jgi:hypothetical protein